MPRFVTVAKTSDLLDGEVKTVTVNNKEIGLARVKGKFYAFDNMCPHRQGQLADGNLAGHTIICPLHFWDFDIKTGVSSYNSKDTIQVYGVRTVKNNVQINAEQIPIEGEKIGYLQKWERHNDPLEPSMNEIHKLSKGIKIVSAMGTEKKVIGFENILFKPAQLASQPLLDAKKVDSLTVIGSNAKKPLKISMPIIVSHMSFGALSREAKIAIAKATAKTGTAMGSGEGGMLPSAQKNAKHYIFEMASGYFGWNKENIKKASAIEIKIGQSAKPGFGGLLPGKKVTKEIAMVRGVKPGQSVQSPSRFPDINSKHDLKKRVAWIKKISRGKPVGIKIAAGHIEKDIDIALFAKADYITIDGRGGGTGAAEDFAKDNFGVPLVYAIRRARRHLDKRKAKGVTLVATGRIRVPSDFLKCLALGADAVCIATAAMMAIGCQQYRACNNDSCPVGIATQKQSLRNRFDIKKSVQRLENFLNQSNLIMQRMTGAMGKKKISEINVYDVFTTDSEISFNTDIKHAGNYE